MVNGLSILETAILCWTWLKKIDKWLKYVGNDVDVWEMAKICEEMALVFDKRLKYAENDLEIWEMAKIFGKWLRCIGHGLSI